MKPAVASLLQAPVRGYIPYYLKKYDDYFKPRYYDNVRRQPQSQGKTKYNTQDPLFFDYRHAEVNGGIQIVRNEKHNISILVH